jgi:hypothetical protein
VPTAFSDTGTAIVSMASRWSDQPASRAALVQPAGAVVAEGAGAAGCGPEAPAGVEGWAGGLVRDGLPGRLGSPVAGAEARESALLCRSALPPPPPPQPVRTSAALAVTAPPRTTARTAARRKRGEKTDIRVDVVLCGMLPR